MQKLMMSLNAFLRHILRLSEDLKIFHIFLFQEHCSNLILGTMKLKDFACYWKDIYAFTVQSKTFPQGCFQEFSSQGIIYSSGDSLQSATWTSKSKDNTKASICFLILILFSQNIISHLKLFQSCCIIATKDVLQISFRRHFVWVMIFRYKMVEPQILQNGWGGRDPWRSPSPTSLHQPQPPAVGCLQLCPVGLMDLLRRTNSAQITSSQN